MKFENKLTSEDLRKCVESYARLEKIDLVSDETGIPKTSVYRLLKAAGVEMKGRGQWAKGKEWTKARRSHNPEKPKRGKNEPSGYDILTARALGNKSVRPNGYVAVHVGRGMRQYEHIIVAERALGRPLRAGEVVHHINCDKTDNRPENLLICTQKYHLKLHARMRRHPYWRQFGN